MIGICIHCDIITTIKLINISSVHIVTLFFFLVGRSAMKTYRSSLLEM